MNLKKLTRALLFPHIAIKIALTPTSAVFLVYSMVFVGTESAAAIASYVLAAYTLTLWCLVIPKFIRMFKAFKTHNRYARRWQDDVRLRVNISLYGTLIWNASYAAFNLALGLWHHTFWFYSLAAYYISLAVMRFFLVRHTRKHKAGEMMLTELRKYRVCGIIFLIMNLALTAIIILMVYRNRSFIHHEITAIAMAAFTFTSLTVAIINSVRYRKYNSPVYSASKAISLASASVSMLTLESTLLEAFGEGTMDMASKRIMLGATGGIISVFIITMAVFMIAKASKSIRLTEESKERTNG